MPRHKQPDMSDENTTQAGVPTVPPATEDTKPTEEVASATSTPSEETTTPSPEAGSEQA